jgi:hypothetical protein
MNQMIIDYLFDDQGDRNGTWRGLASNKHVLANNYQAVMSGGLQK